MADWVIDTCVVAACDDPESPCCHKAIALLVKVLDTGRLCVDDKREVIKEYMKHVKPSGHAIVLVRKFLGQAGKMQQHSGRLTIEARGRLDKIGFPDSTDRVFVAVASRSGDKLLVTEDGHHFSPQVCAYLAENLGVNVFNTASVYKYVIEPSSAESTIV